MLPLMERPLKGIATWISPWALAALAAWLLVAAAALIWSIPIYANIGGPGLCGELPPDCVSVGTFTLNWEASLGFAIGVASGVAALLAGIVFIARRLRAH